MRHRKFWSSSMTTTFMPPHMSSEWLHAYRLDLTQPSYPGFLSIPNFGKNLDIGIWKPPAAYIGISTQAALGRFLLTMLWQQSCWRSNAVSDFPTLIARTFGER